MGYLLALFTLALLQASPPAGAATFTVNVTDDLNDLTPGNGLCVASLLIFPPFVFPLCSLRAAIEESNGLPGEDTIVIPPGAYSLTIAGKGENLAASGDLDITDDLRIEGNGAEATFIDGNGLDRVFDVHGTDTEVRLQRLSIVNGRTEVVLPGESGGGGIRNAGSLHLDHVLLEDNTAAATGSGPGSGGGIRNLYSLTLRDSTVRKNHARVGGGILNGPGAYLSLSRVTVNDNSAENGGGIASDGTAVLVNTTVSGNRATGADASGGGIFNSFLLEVWQSTITENSAVNGAGIGGGGWLRTANTILAGNDGENCASGMRLESLGGNIEDGDSCLFRSPEDLILTDPRLGRLGDHGGPTHTHALLIGSPAVDRGLDLARLGITTDQRGRLRPDGEGYDIGAFETRKRSIVPLLAPLLSRGD